jgi:hypothetical protein
VSVKNTELEVVKEYVEAVKEAGFSVNQQVLEEEALGIFVYNYSAETKKVIGFLLNCHWEYVPLTIGEDL